MEQVNSKIEQYGVKLAGEYKHQYYKNTEFFCKCGDLFTAKPKSIFIGEKRSCPQCTMKFYREELSKLNIEPITPLQQSNLHKSKMTFRCFCGKIFKDDLMLLLKTRKSCGCLRQKILANCNPKGMKFNRLTVISNLAYIPEGSRQYHYRCLCECGKFVDVECHRALTKKAVACSQSCSRAGIPKSWTEKFFDEKRVFKHLTVLTPHQYIKKNRILHIKCKCTCGHTAYHPCLSLKQGRTVTCHNCNYNHNHNEWQKQIDKYLCTLGMKRLTPYRGLYKRLKLQCVCGKVRVYMGFSLMENVKRGRDLRCQCSKLIRGKLTSHTAIRFHKMIGDGIHNFNANAGNIDVALRYKGKKIAIEYDEWFWHKGHRNRDKKKTLKLIKDGWFVLRVRASHGVLPSKRKISNSLEKLINSPTQLLILTHKTWRGYIDV